MQVAFTPTNPAEARLLAAFMVDFAELMETAQPAPLVSEQPAEAKPEDKPKRTRKPAAEAPAATPPVEEPAQPEAAAPAPATASPSEISVDALRVLFGELSQANKREAAVVLVRKHGFNSIREISDDKRAVIFAELKALL